jgi:hypothetical protein
VGRRRRARGERGEDESCCGDAHASMMPRWTRVAATRETIPERCAVLSFPAGASPSGPCERAAGTTLAVCRALRSSFGWTGPARRETWVREAYVEGGPG